MKILGISAFYHDSAAALLDEGKIVAAAQEERFTRKKHDASYPRNAIDFCLTQAKSNICDIDHIVFYDKPFLKFERLLETYIAVAPKGFQSFRMAMPIWLREKLFLKDLLLKEFKLHPGGFEDSKKLLFSEHHMSHAASAFYPSPFSEAVVLTIDGVGEWATTTVGYGCGSKLRLDKEIHFPHSLGLLYSAFTYYVGFRVNSGEYKLMGLAPYGTPKYKNLILDKLIDLKKDGTFRLDQSYFSYAYGMTMTNDRFASLFGQPVRQPEIDDITQFHMDIAASIQAVTEEILLIMTRALAKEYKVDNLCLAGGVALNCVANGNILRDRAFKRVWVQPAAGDAGGALGAAYAVWHGKFEKNRIVQSSDAMMGSYLGPSFLQDEIEQELTACGAIFEVFSEDDVIGQTSKALVKGSAVGWFQGKMEFGPRALGNRSILADPRSSVIQRTLNLKVKYRESFRPFAPSVLEESVSDWFELNSGSPYMLFVTDVHKSHCREMSIEEKSLFGIDKLKVSRSEIPAVTHVDYSARVQTVNKDTNPIYHSLIKRFGELTGCPVLVNTSFNVRGEPIVSTPTDAFRCFMGTEIEMLVIGGCVLRKDQQKLELTKKYEMQYELD